MFTIFFFTGPFILALIVTVTVGTLRIVLSILPTFPIAVNTSKVLAIKGVNPFKTHKGITRNMDLQVLNAPNVN